MYSRILLDNKTINENNYEQLYDNQIWQEQNQIQLFLMDKKL